MRSIPFSKQDILIVFLGILAFFIFVPILTYLYFAKDLVSKDTIMNRNDTGLIIEDRTGKPFFTFYQAKFRNIVPINEVSLYTQEAVIAGEDKNFYSHGGFSLTGIIRSAFNDFHSGEFAYGGSTITQQLVKNSLLTSSKSLLRKYKELVLAEEIERRYSKKEILEMYLNSVYFGNGSFGIAEAAQTYFGQDAQHLDLAESTYLASLLPAPSLLSSKQYASQQRVRQVHILTVMEQEHEITSSQLAQAESEKLVFTSGQNNINTLAPHFALMIRDELVTKYGEERVSRSGFRVVTTLDSSWQQYAEQVVKKQVANLAPDNVSNGAAVVMDPKTGQILSLVGSVDWNNPKFGKVNMATTPRQVGSSFKPIVYSEALETRLITPATILKDVPTTFPGNYKPLDYDRRFRGNVTVRRALDNSLNIPSVEVMQRVGVPAALDTALRYGITTLGTDPSNYGLSLVLGTGEIPLTQMTRAYAIFANGGVRNDIVDILQIDDKASHVVYKYQANPVQELSQQAAFLISSILSDNQTRAEEFGNTLTIDRTAAVKTGTTEDYKDALTIGYTPSLVVGVWVGNNNDVPMDQIAGSLGAAPIWRQLMEHFLADKPDEGFTVPFGVIKTAICTYNGLLASPGSTSSARIEYFLSGTQPTQYCYQSASRQFNPQAPTIAIPQVTSIPVTTAPTQPVTQPPTQLHTPPGQDKKGH